MAIRFALLPIVALTMMLPPLEAVASGPAIACDAEGYDVMLTNESDETLPPGTRISWNVRFVRHSGEIVLEESVAPGGGRFISGALGSDYLSSPQSCTAQVEGN
jgi:hypothetical protein